MLNFNYSIAESVTGVTIMDTPDDNESETQAATVDFSLNEVSITPSIAAAATGNSETETKFSSSVATSDANTLNHLQSGKRQIAKQYSMLICVWCVPMR